MHQAIWRSIHPPPPAHATNKITPHKPRPRLFLASQTNIPETQKRAFARNEKAKKEKKSEKQRIASKGKKAKRKGTILQ